MFGIFKRKSTKEKLLDQYKRIQEQAFKLSKSDRRAADLKYAEAEELMKKIEQMS